MPWSVLQLPRRLIALRCSLVQTPMSGLEVDSLMAGEVGPFVC